MKNTHDTWEGARSKARCLTAALVVTLLQSLHSTPALAQAQPKVEPPVLSGSSLTTLQQSTAQLQRVAEQYMQAMLRGGVSASTADRFYTDLHYWARLVVRAQTLRRQQADQDLDKADARSGASARVKQRERETLQLLKLRSKQLEDLANDLMSAASAKDAAKVRAAVRQILQLLQPEGSAPAVEFKANSQAWLDVPERDQPWRPGLSPVQLRERLFGPLRVAAVGSISGLVLDESADSAQPTTADLAFDALTQPDGAIIARVAELGANPVKIQNWVRNNVRFVPGWGVAQSAASTHAQRQGNAYDIATLLISMLRQAQVPARYVYGTVELTDAHTQNWLGTDMASAAQVLARARIPARVTEKPTLQLEHVWVDAWVSGTPSRGAVRLAGSSGDSWWPLDASFKTELHSGGADLAALTGLNAAGVLDAAQVGAQCTDTYAANMNVGALTAAYEQYKQRSLSQIGALGANTQVGELLGKRQIVAENYGVLLGTQPYAVLARATGMAALPGNLRWRVKLALLLPGQPAAVLEFSRDFAALQGKRLTLGFVPETSEDATVLATLLPPGSLPLDIPAYLTRVKAELRLDGELVASGGSFTLGQTLQLNTELGAANTALAAAGNSTLVAGELHAFAFNAHGLGEGGLDSQTQQLNALAGRITNNQLAGLARHDAAGQALAGLAHAYAASIDAAAKLFQRTAGMREARLPSIVRAASRLEPVVEFGIVTRVKAAGVALLVDRLASASAPNAGTGAGSGTAKNVRAYAQQSLERSNAAAHQLLEQVFSSEAGHSALKDIARATAAGQRVYRLDGGNASALLAELNHAAQIESGIAQATINGMAVLVPQAEVDAAGLTTVPVIAQEQPADPAAVGAGSYAIQASRTPWPAAASQIAAAAAIHGWFGLLDSSAAGPLLAQPVPRTVQSINTSRAVLGEADGLRWDGFVAKGEVIDGIFAAGLNRASAANACDWLGSALASQLGGGLPLSSRVNRAPEISSIPVTYAAAGSAYSYAVTATDADGDTLRYRLVAASGALPSGLAINAAGLISWPSAASGSYALTVQVDDGSATAEQRFTLTVGAEPAPLELSAALMPSIANAGEAVTLTALATGGSGGAITVTATLDGQPLALNAQGQGSFSAPPAGAHRIRVTAQAAPVGGASPAPQAKELVLTVRDPADSAAPTAAITSPEPDSEVTRRITVTGTATDAQFAYYQLLVRPSGSNASAWVEIARGVNPVSNGALGELDPTRMANGAYDLGLRVVDTSGQETTVKIPVEIARDLKLGQFRLSFTDVHIDGNGIPLLLTRTYDSSKKDTPGDFGWGWTASANDVTVRKNMALGLQWEVRKPPMTFDLCLAPVGKRRVTVAMPDGGVYRFEARNLTQCATGQVPPLAIVFDGLPLAVGSGTGSGSATAQLEVVVTDPVQVQGGMLVNMDTGEAWNPTDFKFISADGFKYYLREGVGVLQVTDPYGNIISYGQNSYTHHGSSIGLQIERDAQGRITKATDPSGKSLTYAYNAAGELVSVTDRVGLTTHFSYATTSRQTEFGTVNNRHLLTSLTDPRGQVVMSNQFDEYGRLTASADANGQQSTQSFDEANNQVRSTDRRGNATTYTFDAAGNVTRIVDALGGVTEITYDAVGNELTRKDPLGNVVTKTFDIATGKSLTETDALNRTTTTTYPISPLPFQRQNPLSITDPKGNLTSYGYDGQEQSPGALATQITEPLGRTTSISADAKGNLRTLAIAGISTGYEYDAKGRRTKETDSLGNITTYAYDANGNETSRTVTRTVNGTVRSETSTRLYDAENRVVEETDPTGAQRKTTYNAAGKVETSTDALNRTTRHSYDANARLIKTEYPDGTSEAIGYDANGNETSRTDRAGRITRKEYDALNRHVKTIHPDGSADRNEYDAAGRQTAAVNAKGATQRSEFDAAGQLTAAVDASGRRTEHKYDANGNRTETKFADGRTVTFTYDALNRLTHTAYPDGSSQSVQYRPDGRKLSETDTRGTTSTYGYDAKGQLTSVVQSGITTATTYTYDETGAKAVQTDALGRTVQWVYDAAGRPVSRTLPDGSKESFQYDVEGNLLVHTTFGGQKIQRTFDSGGRELTRVIQATANAPARTIAFTYDAAGRRLTQTESGPTSSQGTTRYGYDANGRLIEQDSPQGKLNWAYDEAGHITERTTPEGTTRYEYDGDGRMTKLTAPDGKTVVYSYDPAGRQVKSVQQLNPGIELVTERRYDSQDRQVAIAHLKKTSSAQTLIAGQKIHRGPGGAVSRLDTFHETASFDPAAGQFTGNPTRVQVFSYDANARLTQESEYKGAELTAWLADTTKPATRATSYGYDQVGNRMTKTVTTPAGTDTTAYSYDVNDRLTSEVLTTASGSTVTTTYTWDANGNLAGVSTPTEFRGYQFDIENRLIEVRHGPSSSAASVVAAYKYDTDGQLIGKLTPTKATVYLVDPTTKWPQVALQRVSAGSLQESIGYVWGEVLARQVRGQVASLYSAPAEDLVSLPGHLDTALGAIGNVSNSIEAYAFEAFGQRHSGLVGDPKLTHQFAGELLDADTGLQYHRERWYDPGTGRFLSADEFVGFATIPVSQNRYLYGDADPANNVDPSGLLTLSELKIAQNIQAQLRKTVMKEIAAAAKKNTWGRLKNKVGDAAENYVERFIKQCYKGKKGIKIDKGSKIDADGGFKNTIDFMVSMGGAILNFEVKYKMPPTTSQAFTRMVNQLSLAKSKFGKAKVFFAKEPPGPIQTSKLKNAIGSDSDVLIMGGYIELATEIVGIFGGCL